MTNAPNPHPPRISVVPHPTDYPSYVNDIPERTMGSIARYVLRGIHPGDFVYHCLRNDLGMAVSYADKDNSAALKPIVILLINRIPAQCWGDSGKINDWRERIKSPDLQEEIQMHFPYLSDFLDS